MKKYQTLGNLKQLYSDLIKSSGDSYRSYLSYETVL